MGYRTTTDRLLDRLTQAINTMDIAVDTITVNTSDLETLLSTGSGAKASGSASSRPLGTVEGVQAEDGNVAAAGYPVLVSGRYDSSPRTLSNERVGAIALNASGHVIVDNAAMTTDLAAIEVLLTDANVDHAANEALLIGIDSDTNSIKTNMTLVASAIKSEDAAHSSSDRGIPAFAVRNDALATLAGNDGDYAPLQVDATGALYTNNQFGTFGSILVTGTTATTCGVADRVFVAIYMLTNTVFNSASGGLVAETEQLYLDDTGAGTSIDADAGAAIDGITFPAGMTLYGRYTGFTLASGSVVAYVG